MAFKTNFPGYTILNSKDHLHSCLSYTWMNTWFNAALVATFAPDSVRIHLPIHSSEAPDCGEDSLEQLTWCASRNSCMSSFRIFILKLEASSGLNHRLPNWEFKIINQGKVIRNTAIWKEKKKTCLRSLLFFLRRKERLRTQEPCTIAKFFLCSLWGASSMNRSMKKSTKRPQSYSFLCWGTW